MPLADYKPPTRTILLRDGVSMAVRGLSLFDIGSLLRMHRDSVEQMFIRFMIEQQRIEETGEGWAERDVLNLMTEVLSEAPIVASTIIAYAADEPDEWDRASKLPMPLQLEALRAIGELTCIDEAAAKKMWADAKMMIASLIPSSTIAVPANGMDTSSSFTEGSDAMPHNS